MQLSSSFYQTLSNETDEYTEQVPPPYLAESKDECLPQYMDASVELEGILDQFAGRWDNQRIQHDYYNNNEKSSSTPSTVENTSHLLDRMEDYRHSDQEWSSHSQMKMMQMVSNMYQIQHKPSSSCCTTTTTKKMLCLSSAKSKYYKITLSIAKEREHIVHRLKKMRPSPSKSKPATSSSSSSSCKNEFDQFLNFIHSTSSQFEMPNQRATLIIPTI